MVKKIKSCVFISGNGSNLKSIINSSRDYNFPIKVKLVISNNIKAKGLELAKKYGESEKIVNAIAAHHEQVEPLCPESVLVAAAEALSAARPGARRETLEAYVKRLEKLESLATGFDGVDKAYAIQAGRELRVIVESEKVSDEIASQLAFQISDKIQNEMTYPGQVKITVIRETRSIHIAK